MNTAIKCKDHPDARIVGTCIQCKGPVCVKCVELRGYFCSDACKAAHLASQPAADAESEKLALALEARQAQRADLLATWLFRRIPLIIVVLVLLGLGLFFLDRSGKERWLQKPPESTPFVDVVPSGNSVFAMRSDGTCIAFAGETGTEIWENQPVTRDPSGADMESGFFSWFSFRLEVSEGLVIQRGYDALCVLSAETGKTLWKRSLQWSEQSPASLGNGRMLLVDDGGVSNDRDGSKMGIDRWAGFFSGLGRSMNQRLVCVDSCSGKEIWRRAFKDREIRATDIAGDICFCITCRPPQLEWIPCSKHSVTNVPAMLACENCSRRFTKATLYEMNVMKAADGTPLWTGQMSSGILDQVRLFADRIAVLAGSHLYILSLNGEKKAHSRLPPDTHKACMAGDHAAAATKDGRVVVFSTRDARTLWAQSVGGQAWELEIAADSLYVIAGIPREIKDKMPDGTPKSPVPRTPQEQLMAEMNGQYGSYSAANRRGPPEYRTLINFRLADGRERWRRQPVVGELHVLPDGNCLLLAQGGETAALFISGSGSYVTEHLQRNGKAAWSYKVPEATMVVKADANSVYLLTGEGGSIFGTWSNDSTVDGTIRAVRRRTFINKVRKF